MASGTSFAQKSGGVLKMQLMDTPPSASIIEEGTVSAVVPFMAVFNNLVLFDQNVATNSVRPIVPASLHFAGGGHENDLAEKLHALPSCRGRGVCIVTPRVRAK